MFFLKNNLLIPAWKKEQNKYDWCDCNEEFFEKKQVCNLNSRNYEK